MKVGGNIKQAEQRQYACNPFKCHLHSCQGTIPGHSHEPVFEEEGNCHFQTGTATFECILSARWVAEETKPVPGEHVMSFKNN